VDATGDGCLQLLEVFTFCVVLHGLLRDRKSWFGYSLHRVGVRALCRFFGMLMTAYIFAVFCYGDMNRKVYADQAYAMTQYAEVLAWLWFLQFVWLDKDARGSINAMALIPSCISGICRTYFWYISFEDAGIQGDPVLLQGIFPYVLIGCQIVTGIICMAMSMICINDPAKMLMGAVACPV
jgi:hypothetical protein